MKAMASITSRRPAYVPGGRPSSLIGRAFAYFGLCASRQSLSRLDDAMLKDIGVTREQALKESRRWDVPQNWRR
jgi:uncharacterized protein YjiS (DUF1127 family)